MESTLLTVNDIKNFTTIGQNVDPELLYPFILLSQQMYVEPVLGLALYNDIVSRFDNQQLTGDTQILYESHIIPSIAYSSLYSALPFIAYKIQRSGVSTQTTDVLTPVSPEEMSIIIGKADNMKNFYLNRLEEYLVTNETLFPLYKRNSVNQTDGNQTIYLGYKHRINNPYWDKDYYFHY